MGVKAIVEKDTILFKHNITGYEVCDFFHDFNDSVSSGEFNKVEYNIWKTPMRESASNLSFFYVWVNGKHKQAVC